MAQTQVGLSVTTQHEPPSCHSMDSGHRHMPACLSQHNTNPRVVTVITNRYFRYASPHLWKWNQLPSSFRQPHSVHCPPGSPHPVHITSSQSSPSFSPSITPSTFHLRLITNPFLHSHSYSSRTAFTDLNLY